MVCHYYIIHPKSQNIKNNSMCYLWTCTYIEKYKTMYGHIKHKIQNRKRGCRMGLSCGIQQPSTSCKMFYRFKNRGKDGKYGPMCIFCPQSIQLSMFEKYLNKVLIKSCVFTPELRGNEPYSFPTMSQNSFCKCRNFCPERRLESLQLHSELLI